MIEERSAVIDQGTLLAERILGNGSALCILIEGKQNKNAVLTEVVAKLENDSLGQASFLKTVFQNIAKEGDLRVTDRRDAAMAILTDPSSDGEVRLSFIVAPLVKGNPAVVRAAYVEAVREQTGENDPFSGSIDALLEVGKAIASYLNQDGQGRGKVIEAWKSIVDKFRETDQKNQIYLELEKIKERMSRTSVFDVQVEGLRKQGLTNAQIAEKLRRSVITVQHSASRLIAIGRIEPRYGETVRQTIVQLDEDVAKLRKQGLANEQIAKQLGRAIGTIRESAQRLIAARTIKPRRRGAPVSESTRQLDVNVQRLRKDGLNNYQIAEKLERKRADIDDSIRRLLATGQTERR